MRARVSAVLFDGTKQEADGAVFSLADRVAFERRFQIPAAKMSQVERWLYMADDREVKENPDLLGQLRPGGEEFREEWLVYFAYRLLRRTAITADEYEAWLEKVDDVSVDLQAEEVPNPTEPARPSGPSES